jgi:hypothetical protein
MLLENIPRSIVSRHYGFFVFLGCKGGRIGESSPDTGEEQEASEIKAFKYTPHGRAALQARTARKSRNEIIHSLNLSPE